MIRRYLVWMDRGNPLRGRSPLYVFGYTLLWYGAGVVFVWLALRDDPTSWSSFLFVYTVIWFNWVWRA